MLHKKEPFGSFLSPAGARVALHSFYQARVEGIEPPQKVLETFVLPLYDTRLYPAKTELKRKRPHSRLAENFYLVSLCKVCFLQCTQNLLSSNLFLRVFLFFLEK